MRDAQRPYFPLFIDLSKEEVLVVGAGKIGMRRIQSLHSFTSHITVIDPKVDEVTKQYFITHKITYKKRPYKIGDCQGKYLVIAATNCREVNHQIGEDCKKAGSLAIISDCKEECTVYFPGIVRKENLVVGVTASGKNHKLASEITKQIRELFVKKEENRNL